MEQLSFDHYRQENLEFQIADSKNRCKPFNKKDDFELLGYLGFETINVRGSIHQILKELQKTDIRARVFCELAKRYNKTPFPRGKVFENSQDIFEHYQYLRKEKQEHLIVVLLDNLKCFVEEHIVTIGIQNKYIIHPRELFFPAIKKRAAAIVCVRNNTNGSCQPREEDGKTTRRMGEVGSVVGIPLVDFVVIGDLEYYSMADNGML